MWEITYRLNEHSIDKSLRFNHEGTFLEAANKCATAIELMDSLYEARFNYEVKILELKKVR